MILVCVGIVLVRIWYDSGIVLVWTSCGDDIVFVFVWYGLGMVLVLFLYGVGVDLVWLWYGLVWCWYCFAKLLG